MSVYEGDSSNYLREALNSLSNQTKLPDQVVIVLDGPIGEELEEEINYFKTKQEEFFSVDIIPLKENIGLGLALNEGLNYCKNNFVVRMDSDDISLPGRLEAMSEMVNENPGASVYGAQIEEFRGVPENKIGKRIVKLTNKEIYEDAKYRNPINHVTVVFRKDHVISSGGYRDFKYFEDYYLWLRMMLKGYYFLNHADIQVLVRGGADMIGRRHGHRYAMLEYKIQKFLLSDVFKSRKLFIRNIIFRVLPRYLPKGVLSSLYRITRKS